MTTSTGPSEVRQARIGVEPAAELRADAAVLGLDGRTDTVGAALRLLRQRAAEERTARDVDDFHGGRIPPLPMGVRRAPSHAGGESDAAA